MFWLVMCNYNLFFLKILSALFRFTFQECLQQGFTVSSAITCTQNKFKHIFIEAKQILQRIQLIRLIAANGDCKELVSYTVCACLCDVLLCCYSCSLGRKRGNHLFSISIWTLHTRSLARVRIFLMLWCSAISEREK